MQLSEFPSNRPIIQIPNWALFVLFFAYALPGNIGHAPWRGDDVLHISVTYSMLRDGHWLTPMLAGSQYTDWGPLTYWLGAISGLGFSWLLPAHDGIRLSMVAALAVFVLFLRLAAKEYYGRDVASATVLLTLGSLGLLIHAHEMQPQIVILACSAVNLYGVARLRNTKRLGALISGTASGAAFLAGGLTGLALTIPLIMALPMCFREYRNKELLSSLTYGLIPLLACCFGWPLLLAFFAPVYLDAWWINQFARIIPHTGHLQQLKALCNLIGWFAWPLWPVALWSLWHRRQRFKAFGHAMPVVAFSLALWITVTTGPLRPANALPLLSPLILISAAELCRLRRGATNAFDWFGVLTFSIVGFFLWLAWTGLNFGWPAGLARNIHRLTPEFTPAWWWFEVCIAALLSIGWIAAIVKVPFFQQRGAVHWALGVVLTWGLATTLWLPWFDFDKNYQQISSEIAAAIKVQTKGSSECVAGRETGDAQRGGLYYFENLKLEATTGEDTRCPLMLTYASGKRPLPDISQAWHQVWKASRGRGRFQEQFALYRKAISIQNQ